MGEFFKSVFDTLIISLSFQSIFDFLKTALDLLIVAYLIYKLIILTRQTRAWQLLKGLIFVLIGAHLSGLFGLTTVQTLLENTIQYIALATVVLFQPELRRILEQIGRSNFRNLFNSSDSNQIAVSNAVEAILSCVETLAANKTGALIILEGRTKLGDMMDVSTEIDSKVSAPLLVNIFEPDTPLHDGAVIIRNTRIKAAAAYLPLSKNSQIPKELGTRHRAAIGVSEVSDALALVVSEETGQISVAQDGNLQRGLTPDLVRIKLRVYLQINEDENKPKTIYKNWISKLGGKKDESSAE